VAFCHDFFAAGKPLPQGWVAGKPLQQAMGGWEAADAVKPLKNVHFCSRPRKVKILTTPEK